MVDLESLVGVELTNIKKRGARILRDAEGRAHTFAPRQTKRLVVSELAAQRLESLQTRKKHSLAVRRLDMNAQQLTPDEARLEAATLLARADETDWHDFRAAAISLLPEEEKAALSRSGVKKRDVVDALQRFVGRT